MEKNKALGGVFIGGGLAVVGVAIIVVGLVFNAQFTQWFGLVRDWVKYEAVQGCMEAGTEEYAGETGSNSRAVLPNKEAYQECMKEKGL